MNNVKGVGIDLVSIDEIKNLDSRTNGSFYNKTFSQSEKSDAVGAKDKYEFLAGRFAVKEAVYKAICGSFPEVNFDFRIVETQRLENGAPKLRINCELEKILNQIGIKDVLISISNQGDMVIAIAQIVD